MNYIICFRYLNKNIDNSTLHAKTFKYLSSKIRLLKNDCILLGVPASLAYFAKVATKAEKLQQAA